MTEKNRNQKLGNKWNETFFQKKKNREEGKVLREKKRNKRK